MIACSTSLRRVQFSAAEMRNTEAESVIRDVRVTASLQRLHNVTEARLGASSCAEPFTCICSCFKGLTGQIKQLDVVVMTRNDCVRNVTCNR